MDYKRTRADVVIVGLGWAGSVMAEELTRAGLEVVAIERGAWRETSADFPTTTDPDELRYAVRKEILQPAGVETYTFRNNESQTALPGREWNNWTLGMNVGGAGTHWAAASWRFLPWDMQVESNVLERYGRKQLVDGLIVQDWGITYDVLEPFYDRFEKIAGTAGTAGVINGQKQPGGNPFEGSRSHPYPTPSLVRSRWNDLFSDTTKKMGYHPFPVPAGTIGAPYTNPLGINLAPCTYCGYCQLYGCGNWSKSSPNACVMPALMQRKNFTMLTECEVLRIEKSSDGKTATGAIFIDSDGNYGFQPADIVVISAYQLDNVRLLMLSRLGRMYNPRTGEGTLGRAFNFQTLSYAFLNLENEYLNPFMNTGALATQIDDFNGDNFDHSGLGFIGGAGIQALSNAGLPISLADQIPPGHRQWGSSWKKDFKEGYQNWAMIQGQGTSYAHRTQYLDLDPTYKDRHGQPLLRMTYDYNLNDKRSGAFIRDRCREIAEAVGGKNIRSQSFADDHYNPYRPFDSSHTMGGAVMGLDPATSVLNRFQQHWDAHNVFVSGASSFPNNGGYNPTITIGALTLHTARAIIDRYIKNPGSLV
ncbi:GMC family oxidoreductase [Pantoea endophytica]|uniref:GMC family oxidoreductase n=1 Tax=Pantoea endophytica TaxID=92488 RepID=UPI002412E8F3|nr:GMC family oxidoreductase [Pantoea endophytica]